MNNRYFRYLMKSFWSTTTVYITMFGLFLIIIPFVIDSFCGLLFGGTIGHSPYMIVMGPCIIFLSGLLPLLIHNRYFSKNRSDIILSMPMNRKQAFITEGVFGLCLLSALIVMGYVLGHLLCLLLANGHPVFGNNQSSLIGLALLYLAAVITYLSSTFAVSVSNNGFQAVFMIMLVNTLPGLLNVLVRYPSEEYWMLNGSINWFSQVEVFENTMVGVISNTNRGSTVGQALIALFFQLLFWGGMVVVALFEFKKMKSEHLGTVISERFGAVNSLTFITLLCFAAFTEFTVDNIIAREGWKYAYLDLIFAFAYFLLSLFYFIFVFIVRRKAKMRKDDWVRFAIAIGGGIVLGAAMFGIIRAVSPDPYYYLALL